MLILPYMMSVHLGFLRKEHEGCTQYIFTILLENENPTKYNTKDLAENQIFVLAPVRQELIVRIS